MFTKPLN